MLLLILAHRDIVGLIEQDIRRHQRRIGEETAVDVLAVLGGLVLKLRHARELAEHRIAVQDPAELGVLRHVGLDEQRVLLGVQAAGDVLRQLLEASSSEVHRNLPHGDGVHVHDAVQAVILVLQRDPVFDCAHIRAQRQIAARLNARKDAFFLFHIVTFFA